MFIDQAFLNQSKLTAVQTARFNAVFPTGCRVTTEMLLGLMLAGIAMSDLFAGKIPEDDLDGIRSLEAHLQVIQKAKQDGEPVPIASGYATRTHPTNDFGFEMSTYQAKIIRLVMVHTGHRPRF